MKNAIKILWSILLFGLAGTNFLFAQKNPPPNPNIAICNNLDSIITVEQIQSLITDSCISILSSHAQFMEDKILSFKMAYAPLNFSNRETMWQEEVIGNKLTPTILNRFKSITPGGIILIFYISIRTRNGIEKQFGREYRVRQTL